MRRNRNNGQNFVTQTSSLQTEHELRKKAISELKLEPDEMDQIAELENARYTNSVRRLFMTKDLL